MGRFNKCIFFISILAFGIAASATVRNAVIKGKIVAFNSEYVSVKNAATMTETKIPRDLFVKEIQSGENVRIELTDAQFEEVQKLNKKK